MSIILSFFIFSVGLYPFSLGMIWVLQEYVGINYWTKFFEMCFSFSPFLISFLSFFLAFKIFGRVNIFLLIFLAILASLVSIVVFYIFPMGFLFSRSIIGGKYLGLLVAAVGLIVMIVAFASVVIVLRKEK
ncbi:MAG: hypothetical protein AAGJ81_16165 [Verrucomicrobiota bacterium]